jgi:MFS family permease
MQKLTGRVWASFLVIGLIGQFAWTIENMYFNVFLYNTISTDPDYIALMVAASAIVATLTTLLVGALSDRLGRRKVFLVVGNLLWGASLLAFGFVRVDLIAALFPYANAVATSAIIVVVLDCVMTFLGSSSNDAGFNAYVTDTTSAENRGRAESVLSILPLVSMLIIFGIFDPLTRDGQWQLFFTIFGVAVSASGILAIFLVKETRRPSVSASFLRDILYGFSPSVIRENKTLYITLCTFSLFSVSVQVFMPYFIIYMQNYLGFDNYAIVLGVVLIAASVASVVAGRFIDKVGKLRFLLPAAAVMFAGLIALYFTRTFVPVILAGIIMMSGYMILTAALSAMIRDCTPIDKAGHFQGIRMVFAVLLPMVIGPAIGSLVIKNSDSTYIDLGVIKHVPTPSIFLAAGLVLLLILVPIGFMRRRSRPEKTV